MAFSVEDVKALISHCKETGIRTFACGELKFSLGDSPVLAKEDPVLKERHMLENEQRLKEEQLDLLRLEDPYEFERVLQEDQEKVS